MATDGNSDKAITKACAAMRQGRTHTFFYASNGPGVLPVLLLKRRKIAPADAKRAKKAAAQGMKNVMGTMRFSGPALVVTVMETPPAQFEKNLALFMKEQGIAVAKSQIEVNLLRPAGPVPPSRGERVQTGTETAGTGGVDTEPLAIRRPDDSLEVIVEGRVLPSLDRDLAPNYNDGFTPKGSELGLDNYDVCHVWGPGLGDESSAGLMLAPKKFNTGIQGQAEKAVARLAEALSGHGIDVRLQVVAEGFPRPQIDPKYQKGAEFLKHVTYRIRGEHDGRPRSDGEAKNIQEILSIDPHQPWSADLAEVYVDIDAPPPDGKASKPKGGFTETGKRYAHLFAGTAPESRKM